MPLFAATRQKTPTSKATASRQIPPASKAASSAALQTLYCSQAWPLFPPLPQSTYSWNITPPISPQFGRLSCQETGFAATASAR